MAQGGNLAADAGGTNRGRERGQGRGPLQAAGSSGPRNNAVPVLRPPGGGLPVRAIVEHTARPGRR